jgi:hypothetical protein
VLEIHGVPIHLQVVPAWLDETAARKIAVRARQSGIPVFVHQHGFSHENHGIHDRRFEFDDRRGFDAQLVDIQQGQSILKSRLGEWLEPIFSPPWNRWGLPTLEALVQAGFCAFSGLERAEVAKHPSLTYIPMTIDPIRWRPDPHHQAWEATQEILVESLTNNDFAGLELHHAVMTSDDVENLDLLLGELCRRGVRWETMESVAARRECR